MRLHHHGISDFAIWALAKNQGVAYLAGRKLRVLEAKPSMVKPEGFFNVRVEDPDTGEEFWMDVSTSEAGQPEWELIGTIGDADPVSYGGCYIFRDRTGRYCEEAEYIEPDDEDDPQKWTVYRYVLERCTLVDGILSDNPFHPTHAVWFADDIVSMTASIGVNPQALRMDFTSEDPIKRAWAYMEVGNYHGFENLDEYPLEFKSEDEVRARYESRGASQ